MTFPTSPKQLADCRLTQPQNQQCTTQVYATHFLIKWASLVAQLVKNPPAMQETWVRSLGCEDPLEEEKATHSSILAWIVHGAAKSQTRISDFDLTFLIK